MHPQKAPISTNAIVRNLKETNQDFEWYPTTDAMLDAIKEDMARDGVDDHASVLDCGAGTGKALHALTDGDKYAIEISKPLLSAIKHDVFVIGTDFHQQTLIDKACSVLFSNPPYSDYERWVEKIILEGNAKESIYLVIPSRWSESGIIQRAIEARNVEPEVIFTGDFLDGERKARAKINIVKIPFNKADHISMRELHRLRNDPNAKMPKTPKPAFDVWFDEHFKIKARKDKLSEWERKEKERETLKREAAKSELVEKKGIIEALVEFYHRDLDKLMKTYAALSDLDGDLLSELDVNISGVKEALKLRVKGLKDLYWKELFNRLSSVTDRLTSKSREALLDKLFSQTSIDFSADNAHALAGWVVKNANLYLDQQIIDTMEKMVKSANVKMYVSNQKTFSDEDWFYGRHPKGLSHFKLDHRVVLSNLGGLKINWFDGRIEGLAHCAETFLNDLMTVAVNIGFATHNLERCDSMTWDSGRKNAFKFRDLDTGKLHVLFEAKAFRNGNVHIKFNQGFICALNCEFGRLKGWLQSREQAAEELDIPFKDTICFGANKQLLPGDIVPRIGFGQAA